MCQQDMTLPSSSTSRRGCLGLNMSRWQDVLAGYSAPDLVEDETHDALKRLELLRESSSAFTNRMMSCISRRLRIS